MKIQLCQTNIIWENKELNLKKAEKISKKVLTKGVGFGIIFEHLTKRPKRKGQGERP